MRKILLIFNWMLGLILLVIAILLFLSGKYDTFIIIFLMSLLVIPITCKLVCRKLKLAQQRKYKYLLISILFLIFLFVLVLKRFTRESVYDNQAVKSELMLIYNNMMNQWYTAYDSIYLKTDYGEVYVIISGNPNNPPLLLLPSAKTASWSWIYNIVNLTKNFRTYAIDLIGEPGRSTLSNHRRYPDTDQDICRYYNEIMDKLGIEKATIVGAGVGGYQGLRYVQGEPERVEKLVLIGSRGFLPAIETFPEEYWVRYFPIKPIIKYSAERYLGRSSITNKLCYDWMYKVLGNTKSQTSFPRLLIPGELNLIKLPVLMIMGQNDRVTGTPEQVIPLASNLNNVKIEILSSSHLINIEKSGEVNNLINEFLLN